MQRNYVSSIWQLRLRIVVLIGDERQKFIVSYWTGWLGGSVFYLYSGGGVLGSNLSRYTDYTDSFS
jgi:hypothetical protein